MSVPSAERGEANGSDALGLKRLTNLRVLQIACDDGCDTLALSGELDMTSSWLLDHPLLQIGANGARSFTLDLQGLTFIDSTGVRAVLAARGLCAARECEFTIIPGPAQVQRMFEAGRLIDHLPFTSHKTGAVAEGPTVKDDAGEAVPRPARGAPTPSWARREPPSYTMRGAAP